MGVKGRAAEVEDKQARTGRVLRTGSLGQKLSLGRWRIWAEGGKEYGDRSLASKYGVPVKSRQKKNRGGSTHSPVHVIR